MAEGELDPAQRGLLSDMVAAVDRGEPGAVKRGALRAWLRSLPAGSADAQRVEMLVARLPEPPKKPAPPPRDPEAAARGRKRAEGRNSAQRQQTEAAERARAYSDPWAGR